MKKNFFIITVLITVLFFVSGVGSWKCFAETGGKIFNISRWAEEEFSVAREYGLIPETIFFKDYTSHITRLEFCEMVVGLYEKLTGSSYKIQGFSPFLDTSDINVIKAYELNIVTGLGEGMFEPQAKVTRQQAAAILTNLLTVCKIEVRSGTDILDSLVDAEDIAAWARESVAVMMWLDYMKGDEHSAFLPLSNMTVEQAVMLAVRFFVDRNPERQSSKINITSHSDNTFIANADFILSWDGSEDNIYTVYIYQNDLAKPLTLIKKLEEVAKQNRIIIPAAAFSKDGEYYMLVKSDKNVYSKPVRFYTGEKSIKIKDKDKLKVTDDRILNLEWVGVDEAAGYDIQVQQSRISGTSIPPAPLTTEKVWGSTNFSFQVNYNRKYEIKIHAFDRNQQPLGYTDTAVVYSRYPVGRLLKDFRFDGENAINSKETADRQMKTITVDVWRMDSNGKKTASTASLTVHSRIADVVYNIFEEIFSGAEQFPIIDLGGYAWRAPMSSGRLSEHNYGTAIDINSQQNYCIYSNGTTIGSHWLPYIDDYSITPYGDVINAFENNGFTWGGDAWSNPKDYMHFSYFGT